MRWSEGKGNRKKGRKEKGKGRKKEGKDRQREKEKCILNYPLTSSLNNPSKNNEKIM